MGSGTSGAGSGTSCWLVRAKMPGIRITEEVRPVSMKRFSDQLYVYSFPKNMSGLCRLKVKGEAGTRITLKHGELLKKDGRLEQGNINVYYHPVKPDEVFQMDVFTLKGTGEEEISCLPSLITVSNTWRWRAAVPLL